MSDSKQVRTALITGASRGLGLALAERLAASGWRLILDARGEDALEEASRTLSSKAEITAIPGDISDPSHRRDLAEAARNLGGLDLLVNNASTLGPSPLPSLLDYPLDALERVYRINVVAPLALIQEVREHLNKGAAVVNITSDAAVEPYEGWGGYGSSKAALERISAGLAAEDPSLHVYTVDPGDMRTQMHQDAFPEEDISDRPLPEESVPGILRLVEEGKKSGRYSAQEKPKEVRSVRVSLTTDDFDEARNFYGEALGLKVMEQWTGADGNGVIFEAGGATVEVLDRQQAAYVDEVETGRRSSSTPSSPVRLAFEVSDTGAVSERLLAAGATADGPVTRTPWEDFNRRVTSPDGQRITIYEVSGSETSEPAADSSATS